MQNKAKKLVFHKANFSFLKPIVQVKKNFVISKLANPRKIMEKRTYTLNNSHCSMEKETKTETTLEEEQHHKLKKNYSLDTKILKKNNSVKLAYNNKPPINKKKIKIYLQSEPISLHKIVLTEPSSAKKKKNHSSILKNFPFKLNSKSHLINNSNTSDKNKKAKDLTNHHHKSFSYSKFINESISVKQSKRKHEKIIINGLPRCPNRFNTSTNIHCVNVNSKDTSKDNSSNNPFENINTNNNYNQTYNHNNSLFKKECPFEFRDIKDKFMNIKRRTMNILKFYENSEKNNLFIPEHCNTQYNQSDNKSLLKNYSFGGRNVICKTEQSSFCGSIVYK